MIYRVRSRNAVILLILPPCLLFVGFHTHRDSMKDLASFGPAEVDSSVDDFLSVANAQKLVFLDRQILMDVARLFDMFATANGLRYHAGGAAVLGYVRHGELVPWDDYYSVFVSKSQQELLESAMAGNKMHGLKVVKLKDRLQYRITLSKKDSDRWPYADIFLYKEEGENIVLPLNRNLVFKKSIVFPVARVELGTGLIVNLPRCPWLYAKTEFGSLTRCCTSNWSHKLGQSWPLVRCLECASVKEYFPFAKFLPHNSSFIMLEILDDGGRAMYRFTRAAFCGVKM